jgi:hypothetical protein
MGKFESLYRHDGWGIGMMTAGATELLSGTPPIAWLPIDGRHAFCADPFLIDEGGTLFCFFESLPYATDRGKICYVDVGAAGGGNLTVHEAFAMPYHLSYPYLLRHDGEILCIPEAGASGRVSVFAARAFPEGWYEKRTLIDDFAAVDPTIFQHDGRWWMLATDARSAWNSDLHVWYADELFGRWQRHAGNPVKRDPAGSRPGGRPFSVDGRLYRPAQDCSVRYGGRLIINEILELSPERFVERAVNVLEPDRAGPYPDGLHTANACGDVVVVDGNRLHFELRQAARAVARRANRLVRHARAGEAAK